MQAAIPAETYTAVRSDIQGAQDIALQLGGELTQALAAVANQAFVAGMTRALLVAASTMSLAAAPMAPKSMAIYPDHGHENFPGDEDKIFQLMSWLLDVD